MTQDIWVNESGRPSVRDRVLLMRSKPMFEGLDDDGLLLLAEHGHQGFYRDGEVITPEGEPGRQVYVIDEGEIEVSSGGKWIITRKAGEGFGALQVLSHEPSPLAVARGDVRTLEVPGSAFESALTENFSLLRTTLTRLGESVLQIRGNLPINPDQPRTFKESVWYDQPKTLVERLVELRQQPFGRMNLDALVDMVRGMGEVRYPAGALLWAIGEPSTHALTIDCGTVICTAADGRHVKIGAGFTLGVLDVWRRSRVYEVRTETPVIAYRAEFEGFLALLEKHPEVGLELLRGFARDLSAAHGGASVPPAR